MAVAFLRIGRYWCSQKCLEEARRKSEPALSEIAADSEGERGRLEARKLFVTRVAEKCEHEFRSARQYGARRHNRKLLGDRDAL